MNKTEAIAQFESQTRSLTRYRAVLMLGVLLNFILVVRIPYRQIRAATANQTERQQAARQAATSATKSATAADGGPLASARAASARQPQTKDAEQTPTAGAESEQPILLAVMPPSHYATDIARPNDEVLEHAIVTPTLPNPDVAAASATPPQATTSAVVDDLFQHLAAGAQTVGTQVSKSVTAFTAQWRDIAESHVTSAQSSASRSAPTDTSNSPASMATNTGTQATANAPASGLTLRNPADNGGPVSYLLDGTVHTLAPGETQTVPPHATHTIRFDRGGGFGIADVVVDRGTFQFTVSDKGWSLGKRESVR